jgi:SAM-dependent methyltransferase
LIDYGQVTESWDVPASPEQLAMQYCRYRMAGDLAEGKSVLEIGCGSGMGLPYLKERASRVVGGEYTPRLLEEARAHVSEVELVQMDAQDLPYPDGSFDVVLMLEMIYYVPDLERAFAEARRVLKPGGALFVCLPNRDRPDFNPSPHALAYPNVPELAALFARHGFQVRILGGFPVEAEGGGRDSLLRPLRHVAVKLHLIPRSMRMKALVKTLLYGRLPKLGRVRDGMSEYQAPVEVDPALPNSGYKNLYAIGAR